MEIKKIRTYSTFSGYTTNLKRTTLHIMDDTRRIASVHNWSIDGSLSEINSSSELNTNKIRYQYGNHIDSASLELSSTGSIISYEEYFPYGDTCLIAGTAQKEVKLKEYRYTGKEKDDVTGLYYYGARYYASWLGRWMSTDPLFRENPSVYERPKGKDEEAAYWGKVYTEGLNLYCYVKGNPVVFIDPIGRHSINIGMGCNSNNENTVIDNGLPTQNELATSLMRIKLSNGSKISNDDISSFINTMHQYSEGGTTLQTELETAIKRDPEAFKEYMNGKSIEKYAMKIQAIFCVQIANYTQMVFNKREGAPKSIGDFFKTLVEHNMIWPGGGQREKTQKIFDLIYGAGNTQVIGYGIDPGGGYFNDAEGDSTSGYTGGQIMDELQKVLDDKSVNCITVRVKVKGAFHDMSIIRNGDGTFTLNDSSFRGTNIEIGSDVYNKYIKDTKIISFYYLKN